MTERTSVEAEVPKERGSGAPLPEKPSAEPWKLTMSDLWIAATRGRKPLAVLLVIVLFLIPAGWGVGSFYWTTAKSAYDRFFATSLLKNGENNFRNEWIAVVSYWPTEESAKEGAAAFKELYVKYEKVMRRKGHDEYPIWRDDIQVARDPSVPGRWIIGIDTFYGSSNEPAVSDELRRIARLGGADPEAQNKYQRLFVNHKALCYSQRVFERTYGKIDPPPTPKEPCDGSGSTEPTPKTRPSKANRDEDEQ